MKFFIFNTIYIELYYIIMSSTLLTTDSPLDAILNTTYKSIFPNNCLKDLQLEILTNLLNGIDVVAILMTGYGKSICYQLPFIYYNATKSIIVISPLIALMEDQQINLNKINIPSICFNSNLSTRDKSIQKELILECNEHKIIYITPETLLTEQKFIQDLISQNTLALIAIDEAHCISAWGHNFRKEYQLLNCLKIWAPTVPIFACTATATTAVQTDIITNLGLTNAKIIKSSFNRENLYIECHKKTNIEIDIHPYLQEYLNEYIIIYAKTRNDTELICKIVNSLNIKCNSYHGGMSAIERKDIHHKFASGECKCIVATQAFGMGIDQNIHLIIHYGVPNDMESYYQEIGRAGRDGVLSKCILFWNTKDFQIGRLLLSDISDSKYKKFKEEQLQVMKMWLMSSKCRKIIILHYFNEILSTPCLHCDNCSRINQITKKFDLEPIFYMSFLILKTILLLKVSIGSTKIIDIIRGSNAQTVANFKTISTYNTCNKYPVIVFKELIHFLLLNDYMCETSSDNNKFGSVLTTTAKTLSWWNNAKQFKLENEMQFVTWDFNTESLTPDNAFSTLKTFINTQNKHENKIKRQTVLQLYAPELL